MLSIIGILAKLLDRSTLNTQYEYSGSDKFQLAIGSRVYEISAKDITDIYRGKTINEKFFLSLIGTRLINFGFQKSTGFTIMKMGSGLILSNRNEGSSFVIRCEKCEYNPPYMSIMSYTSFDFLDSFNCIASNDSIRHIQDNDVRTIVNAISNTCSTIFPEHTSIGMYANEEEFINTDGRVFYMIYFPYTTSKYLGDNTNTGTYRITITKTRDKN